MFRLLTRQVRTYSWKYYAGDPIVENGVMILKLDAKDSKVNTLNPALQDETHTLWEKCVIPKKDDIKAIVFMSSKTDNFIAGADISMLSHHKKNNTEDELKHLCMSGHELFDTLKSTGIPLIAAIHGTCLGGGLEWALKCDYRIATTSPVTKLGLPEVKLGLLPGWGGTYALPKLVGLTEALPMLLQGKEINAFKAKKIGLVNDVCDVSSLETLAVQRALELDTMKKKTQKIVGCGLCLKRILDESIFSIKRLKRLTKQQKVNIQHHMKLYNVYETHIHY